MMWQHYLSFLAQLLSIGVQRIVLIVSIMPNRYMSGKFAVVEGNIVNECSGETTFVVDPNITDREVENILSERF